MPLIRRPWIVAFALPFVALYVVALRTVYFGTTTIETAVFAHFYAGMFGWGVLGVSSIVAGVKRASGGKIWLMVAAAICAAALAPRVLPSAPEPDYCGVVMDYPGTVIEFVPAPALIHCRVDVHTMAGALAGWWILLGCIGWWNARSARAACVG